MCHRLYIARLLKSEAKENGNSESERILQSLLSSQIRYHLFLSYIFLDLTDARYNFAASVAGYSLVCYILQIKDRHNGNILLDKNGHIIHIDFDYFISNSPGNNFRFEQAPFKLTSEYIDVMEGVKSDCFAYFKKLMVKGFIALQKEYKKIVVLIAMMLNVNQHLPCFVENEKIISELHCKLFPKCNGKSRGCTAMSEKEAEAFIEQYNFSLSFSIITHSC